MKTFAVVFAVLLVAFAAAKVYHAEPVDNNPMIIIGYMDK